MKEITIVDLIKYYFKKIWIIVIGAIFAFFIGYFYTNEYLTPIYQESATIILGKNNDGENSNELSYSTITLYDSLIKNYLELLESDKLLNDIKNNLNLDYSLSELEKMLEYSISDTSQIIIITAKNPKDEVAVKICNEAISVLKDNVYEIYGLDNITVVDKAVKSGNLEYSKNTIIFYFLLAAVLLFSANIILYYIFIKDKNIKVKKEYLKERINHKNKNLYPSLKDKIAEKEIKKLRHIRTNLLEMIDDKKVIMVTSSSKNQYKSFAIYALAKSILKTNKRILIIDANAKDGFISKELCKNKLGLLDILDEKTTLKKALCNLDGVDVLTLGNKNKIDLISSEQLKKFIDNIRNDYDFIFIEVPRFKNNFEPQVIVNVADTTISISKYSNILWIQKKLLGKLILDNNFLGTIKINENIFSKVKRKFKICKENKKAKKS